MSLTEPVPVKVSNNAALRVDGGDMVERPISPVDLKRLNKLLRLSNPNLKKTSPPASPVHINSELLSSSSSPPSTMANKFNGREQMNGNNEENEDDDDDDVEEDKLALPMVLTPTASPTGLGVASMLIITL